MDKPASNQTVRHVKTRGIYTVIDNDAKVKLGPGDWCACIVYRNAYTGEVFARSTAEFCEAFEPYSMEKSQ